MQYRKLGSSDIDASVVAFGAWAIGGWKWGGTDAKAAVKAITAAVDTGVNFIDTAAVYGFGLSEEIVGKAIELLPRDKLVIATKCGLRWDVESDHLHVESEGRRVFRTLTPDSINWEVDASLKRLKTDYIDLYQTHWPHPSTAPGVVMDTLVELKKAGKIRSIGFCNASIDDLHVGISTGHLDVDQEKYSLLDRERVVDNLPVCEKNKLSFLAYSPMAQGLLTNQLKTDRQYGEGDLRIGNARFSSDNVHAIYKMLEPVRQIATEKAVNVEHVVLAWTLQQPGVSHVLVGARNEEQAASNAKAGSLILTDAELLSVSNAAASWGGFE